MIVAIDGKPVYALVVVVDSGIRLRVASGEWAGLNLVAGAVVDVRVPGRRAGRYLVSEVTPLVDCGVSWVTFLPPVLSRSPRGRVLVDDAPF